jgi:2-O-A-mannosyl-D-glycerate-specific PTS system IIC component
MGGAIAAAGWFGAALVGTAISTLILLIWRRQAVKRGKYVTEDVTP